MSAVAVDDSGWIHDLVARAEGLTQAGRYAEAAEEWRRVAQAGLESGDTSLAAKAGLSAARCAVEVEEARAASADAESAWTAARAANEPGLAAEAAELLGDLARRAEVIPEAERWLREASCQFDTATRPVDRARVLMTLGHFLGVWQRYDEAVDTFLAARDLFRSLGRGLDASHADDRAAAAFIELGQLPEALDRLRAAALVADATGDSPRIAYAQYRLGWTSMIADLGEEALPHLEHARDIYRELGDLVGAANCDEKAAAVLSDVGEHEQAVGLYEHAIAVFDAFGEYDSARIAESNLANIFSDLRRYEEAVARRTSLLERLPSTEEYLRAAVSVRLAEDLVRLGDPCRALLLLRQARSYFEGSENRLEGAKYRAALARALLGADRVSSARSEAESLLDSIDRATLPAVHAKALEVISECERRTGSSEVADRFLAQAVALYLAIDQHERATELSRVLLPDRRRPTSNDQEPRSSYGSGYI